MSIWAVPAVLFAAWLELTYAPSIWVHFVTSLPVLLIGRIALFRPLKAWLVMSQYRH
jgi:uncharacterized protein (DUF983 family)